MKIFNGLLTSLALASCFTAAQATPILIGSSTLATSNDLTVVQDVTSTYQFLDLSSTIGWSQAEALAKYGSQGFSLGTSADAARLFSSFGFSFADSSSYVKLNVSASQATSFTRYLGTTYGDAAIASFSDTTYGQSYFCISSGSCSPTNFFNQSDLSEGDSEVGVFLVRTSKNVPEPGSVALLSLGLIGVAMARRAKKR
jgi:hypothetical protein